MSTVIISLGLFAGAGVLFFSHSDTDTIIAGAQAAAATAPTAPTASTSMAPAMVDVPAVTAPEAPQATPAAAAVEPATEAPKWRQPPPRKAWAKLRLRSPSPATP